jgi:ubiquinone/menaquinone biosynthesis C-methylase UbiE
MTDFHNYGSEFVEWKTTDASVSVDNYTVFNCMLKPFLDEHGLLTGQTVLDLACGNGHYTRQLKALNCSYIVGVDISPTMIKIARDIEQEDPKQIEYIISDVKQLPQFEKPFDIITGFFFLSHAQTREELLAIAKSIYANLGKNKRFFSLTGSTNADVATFNTDKLRKYGHRRHVEGIPDNTPMPDGMLHTFTMYNNRDEVLGVITSHHYTPKTYEEVFREAGFTTLEWVPLQCDPNIPNKEFFDDLIKYTPITGLIATK